VFTASVATAAAAEDTAAIVVSFATHARVRIDLTVWDGDCGPRIDSHVVGVEAVLSDAVVLAVRTELRQVARAVGAVGFSASRDCEEGNPVALGIISGLRRGIAADRPGGILGH
jgi:hypothetical protein